MKPKMTDWFPPHIKPVRVGVYLVKVDIFLSYSYWTGRYWGSVAFSARKAVDFKSNPSVTQDKSWRGFTEKQE